jgi:hypothetical protein
MVVARKGGDRFVEPALGFAQLPQPPVRVGGAALGVGGGLGVREDGAP